MEKSVNKFLKQYQDFVDEVTSDSSKSLDHMIDSIDLMHEQKLTPSRLLTAGIGLSGEVGEFNEIIRKILFQGKEIDENTAKHLRKELGDVMWYVAQACIALDTDIEEVIDINVAKLKDRYPLWDTGGFDAFHSNNRKDGDI